MMSNSAASRPYIGGQAVIEGVMMRAPTSLATAVRRRDGSITIRERQAPIARSGWVKWPFVRGVASLVESLKLGNEALRFSTEKLQTDYDGDDQPGQGPKSGILSAMGLALWHLSAQEPGDSPSGSKSKEGGGGSMVVMAALMMGLLIVLPQLAASGTTKWLGANWGAQSPQVQAVTGAFKLAIVVGYMLAIRRFSLIRRVFQYHGAEHKTISTYEAGEPLDVAHARAKTTRHPRCGTTFLVMVVIVSVVVWTVLGGLMPRLDTGNSLLDGVAFALVKLPFFPLLAGFTFELQRLFARYCTTGPLRVLLLPGFWVQGITTIEPDDAQLEIALAALHATLFRERGLGEDGASEVDFNSYADLLVAERLRPAV